MSQGESPTTSTSLAAERRHLGRAPLRRCPGRAWTLDIVLRRSRRTRGPRRRSVLDMEIELRLLRRGREDDPDAVGVETLEQRAHARERPRARQIVALEQLGAEILDLLLLGRRPDRAEARSGSDCRRPCRSGRGSSSKRKIDPEMAERLAARRAAWRSLVSTSVPSTSNRIASIIERHAIGALAPSRVSRIEKRPSRATTVAAEGAGCLPPGRARGRPVRSARPAPSPAPTAALEDRVQLGAEQHDIGGEIEPGEEDDHRAERAVGRVVIAEIGDVEAEAEGRRQPARIVAAAEPGVIHFHSAPGGSARSGRSPRAAARPPAAATRKKPALSTKWAMPPSIGQQMLEEVERRDGEDGEEQDDDRAGGHRQRQQRSA